MTHSCNAIESESRATSVRNTDLPKRQFCPPDVILVTRAHQELDHEALHSIKKRRGGGTRLQRRQRTSVGSECVLSLIRRLRRRAVPKGRHCHRRSRRNAAWDRREEVPGHPDFCMTMFSHASFSELKLI